MESHSKTESVRKPGFFARIIGSLRARIRKMFGKPDEPNIFPFF